ncbi:uncharacterized protein BX663DRAFT_501647 [Cokeromyces recurvatus]|uniref:uncharacterized protein n=1 Tax=Cokeromyces recurvatus TaxID=90255 RepID=UPI00221F97F8|nr:uncharacterized protein BX663DRAFT_501647 [Cokeromyces recurvatus]KAI7905081.1 hypothetical protein BX663DRAFT_501647 [Cokeromyces recurvatus]
MFVSIKRRLTFIRRHRLKSINHHKHRIKSNTMLASSSTGYYHLSRSKSPIHYYTTAVASPSLPNKVVTTQTIPNLVSTTTTIATAASTTTSFTNHNSTSVIATFPEERATNKVNNNKELGIGLGVGIGCIAALGLVSLLFIHKRKKQQKEPMNNEREISSISTRWQPQNFMGVVASVVSKLPRTPSQSSKASTNNNVDIKSPKSIGIAIGHGEGAVEIDPSYSLPSHLASIDNERRY